VFSGRQASEAAIVRLVEAAIEKDVGQRFFTIVRGARDLRGQTSRQGTVPSHGG
jgi:hypothetical protein